MSIIVNDQVLCPINAALDFRYGPWPDTATALAAIPSYQRYSGLVVGIVPATGTPTVTEYWFENGVTDLDLVPKTGAGAGSAVVLQGQSSVLTSALAAINIHGPGVTVDIDPSGVAQVYIPGANAAPVLTGAKQTTSFTLTTDYNSTLVPVGGGVVVTVPTAAASLLEVGYAVVLEQADPGAFTIAPDSGVTINSPNGLISIGQFTTMALIQTDVDVWLLTIAGAGGSGSGAATGPYFEVLAPPNQAGVLLVGGGDGSGTFVQAGNTYMVTLAGHGYTALIHNGMDVVVPRLFADPSMFNWGAVWYDVGSNFQYIDADHFSMTVASSATASGAVGQINQFYMYPLRQFTISANALGPNGTLRISAGMSQNGTENVGGGTPENHNKYLRVAFGPAGGTPIDCGSAAGQSVSGGAHVIIQNRNNVAKQAWRTGYGAQYSPGGTGNYITVDTTVEQVVTIFGQMDDPTDWLILDYALVEMFRGV